MKKSKPLVIAAIGTIVIIGVACMAFGSSLSKNPEARVFSNQSNSAVENLATASTEDSFNILLTKVAGEFFATLTASVPTATSTPTPTPVAAVGDRVYLLPSSQGHPPKYEIFIPTPYPSDFILSPIRYDIDKLFSTDSVDDCDELMSREESYIDFKFDQPRQVTRELICDGRHYYLIKGIDEWDFWVSERLVSAEMDAPVGFLFHLTEYESYATIPKSLVNGIGDELEVTFQGQPVKVLFQGIEFPENKYLFNTLFMITNNGDKPVTIRQIKDFDLMHKDFLAGYVEDTHGKTAWVKPITPIEVEILPGQSMPMTMAWEWDDRILWEFYMTFNAPMNPDKTVRITKGAAIYLFDLGVEARKAGLLSITPTP